MTVWTATQAVPGSSPGHATHCSTVSSKNVKSLARNCAKLSKIISDCLQSEKYLSNWWLKAVKLQKIIEGESKLYDHNIMLCQNWVWMGNVFDSIIQCVCLTQGKWSSNDNVDWHVHLFRRKRNKERAWKGFRWICGQVVCHRSSSGRILLIELVLKNAKLTMYVFIADDDQAAWGIIKGTMFCKLSSLYALRDRTHWCRSLLRIVTWALRF